MSIVKSITIALHHLIGTTVCGLCELYEMRSKDKDHMYCNKCIRNIFNHNKKDSASCIICSRNTLCNNSFCKECKNKLHISCNLKLHSLFYYEDIIKKIIFKAKYTQVLSATNYLLVESIHSLDSIVSRGIHFDCIVPIPSHKTSVQKRGFNYVYFIANKIGRYFLIPLIELYPTEYEYTEIEKRNPYLRYKTKERTYRVAGEINNETIDTILILDDVLTTGKTMFAVIRALEQYQVKNIHVLHFATSKNFGAYVKKNHHFPC